jgi:HAD superfamily hydrolase (TIGR01509 family)
VLFDLDGVLVDTQEVWYRLLNHVATLLGYPSIDRLTHAACWGQGVEEEVVRFFPRHTAEELQKIYDRHYEAFQEHLTVIEGAADFVARLPQPKAVVTNCPRGIALRALDLSGLRGRFAHVVGADEVPRSKPAPDMVLEACRRLGVPPGEALMIGDTDNDSGAAAGAGVAFVRFARFADLDYLARMS